MVIVGSLVLIDDAWGLVDGSWVADTTVGGLAQFGGSLLRPVGQCRALGVVYDSRKMMMAVVGSFAMARNEGGMRAVKCAGALMVYLRPSLGHRCGHWNGC
jgi:hypothetical protein